MERLTERYDNGNAYYPYYFKENTCDGDGASEKCNKCDFTDRICERLAAYEDTNLTPEQMLEIDKDYRALCEKMAKYETIIAKFGCYEDGHPITCLHCPHVLEGSKCECRYTELL